VLPAPATAAETHFRPALLNGEKRGIEGPLEWLADLEGRYLPTGATGPAAYSSLRSGDFSRGVFE